MGGGSSCAAPRVRRDMLEAPVTTTVTDRLRALVDRLRYERDDARHQLDKALIENAQLRRRLERAGLTTAKPSSPRPR